MQTASELLHQMLSPQQLADLETVRGKMLNPAEVETLENSDGEQAEEGSG